MSFSRVCAVPVQQVILKMIHVLLLLKAATQKVIFVLSLPNNIILNFKQH